MLEEFFGQTITNSSAQVIPTRYIGEQHIKEDLGRIPTMMEWYGNIKMEKWMFFTMQLPIDVREKLMRNEPTELQITRGV